MPRELPQVGVVYRVKPWIFLDGDPKEERPVVVVRAPRHRDDLMTVVERTSTRLDLRGVDHPADANLTLDLDGRWVHRFTRTVAETLFRPPSVEPLGTLGPPYLDEVVRMWEEW